MSRRPFILSFTPVVILLLAVAIAIWAIVAEFLSLLGPVGITVLMIGLSVAWVMLSIEQRRRRDWLTAGCCPACGYDLRESLERCPECGGPIPEELLRRRRLRAILAARRGEEFNT